MDAAGDSVFAWGQFDGKNWRIKGRARSAAGALGPVQTLSGAGQNALAPYVAVDKAGDAVFAWQRFDGKDWRVQTRALSAGGALSPVQNLSLPGQDAFHPRVKVDDDGDAVFIWYRSDGVHDRVQGRARSAAGVLSGVQDISPAGQDAYPGGVAVSSIGRAVFTWVRYDGSDWRAQARARTVAGVLKPVHNLSLAGNNAFEPQVGVSDKGNAVFTWRRLDGRGTSRVQTRALSSADVLSGVDDLSAAGEDGLQPAIAVDATGDAVYAWKRSFRIQARARTSTGSLSGVQNLSPVGEIANDPEVAVDDAGEAVFAWQLFNGYRIQSRMRAPGGALGAVETLSSVQSFFPAPPDGQVAVDTDGDAIVTWLNHVGYVAEAVTGP